jgi:ABC transport system ATP-binding/permease protein
MSKRGVNLNGSLDSCLGSSALHFVSMSPERFDWSARQPPQAGAAQAGLAPARLAEAAPPQVSAPVGGPAPIPDLVVRTRRSVHQFQGGTPYRIGRDPQSDIFMTDSRVSWQHGILRVDGNAWILEDLGSTNGTFLGSQRVDRVDISQDCVVHLGHPEDGPILRFMPQTPVNVAPSPPAPSSPPAPPIPPAAPPVASTPSPPPPSEAAPPPAQAARPSARPAPAPAAQSPAPPAPEADQRRAAA